MSDLGAAYLIHPYELPVCLIRADCPVVAYRPHIMMISHKERAKV